MSTAKVFLFLALVCFILSAFMVEPISGVSLLAMGLAFLVGAQLCA